MNSEVRLGDVTLKIVHDHVLIYDHQRRKPLGKLTLPCAEGRLKAMLLFLKLAQLDEELIR